MKGTLNDHLGAVLLRLDHLTCNLSLAAVVQVTQAAAKIIHIRPPSVYKGKGIRLEGTTPRIKAGKRK